MVDADLLLYSYGYIGILQTIGCALMFTVLFPPMMRLIESGKAYRDYNEEEFKVYAEGTTSYYWALVVGQLAAAYATTTFKQSLLTYGIPNMTLNIFIVLEILLGLAIIYIPTLQEGIGTYDLPLQQILLPFLVSFLPILLIEEIRKAYLRSQDAAVQKTGNFRGDFEEDSGSSVVVGGGNVRVVGVGGPAGPVEGESGAATVVGVRAK